IAKHGFGASSSVWLAESLKSQLSLRYVCIKIIALNIDPNREIQAMRRINDADSSHEGLPFIRKHIDEFQLHGPKEVHLCFVSSPMRETLFRLQKRLSRRRLPLLIFKLFTFCLLLAINFLHTECRLIHTGKPFNSLYNHR
ncbi:hypothetical protein M406DRAFT_270107, partial [Cryphonectria parasitica EP155]